MSFKQALQDEIHQSIKNLYNLELPSIEIQSTRKDFNGDLTVVIFPMLKYIKGNPVTIGNSLGQALKSSMNQIKDFNVIKGFLNLELSDSHFLSVFYDEIRAGNFGFVENESDSEAVMVEYSSPNTNKPLHLGHIRNILLGYSVSNILTAAGKKVYKTQIINDRGIHICKSMVAWQRYANGETPSKKGIKGDKFVGNYYVVYNNIFNSEVNDLTKQGMSEEEAKLKAPILIEAQESLRKWEKGDPETVALWKKMNSWVYEGFDVTYNNMGVDFDCLYYESETYLLGKDFVEEGLENGVFYKKNDGSVWCDLTDDGLDEKIVLRADGTAVYMTQDIGTAIQRKKDYPDISGMVYTVGNEQDYHFKVLFLILKKLGFKWAENLYHLSYGMVDLPSGKMKSREGTVVDADELMEEMTETAREISEELGKLDEFSLTEKEQLYKLIGLGALKYYILKVDPKKRILFDPKESVDFQGNTGPFIQYTYARIQSILRKVKNRRLGPQPEIILDIREREIIKKLIEFPETIQLAAKEYSPALIANYTYDLVKEFNSFYQNISILGVEDQVIRNFRIELSEAVATVIKEGMGLLGIEVPNRM